MEELEPRVGFVYLSLETPRGPISWRQLYASSHLLNCVTFEESSWVPLGFLLLLLFIPQGDKKMCPGGMRHSGNTADLLPLILECLFLWIPKSCAQWLSHVWLCDPMDCSPPGSSVHGLFQPRVLEWDAISYSIRVAGWWPTVWPLSSHVCWNIASFDKMAQWQKQLWLSTAIPDMWPCQIVARALGTKCMVPAPSGIRIPFSLMHLSFFTKSQKVGLQCC